MINFDAWPAPVPDGEIDLIFEAANDNDAANKLIGCVEYKREHDEYRANLRSLIEPREHSQAPFGDQLRNLREQRDAADRRVTWIALALVISLSWNVALAVLYAVRMGWID